ncbi:hypothetical protein B484DRAFT_414811 [Ochromonadaceae sp. CCMP2298]|nr:hypothetical protein B484DRAFT_414811 [Ochromonadaceae sp. CCMP2298]
MGEGGVPVLSKIGEDEGSDWGLHVMNTFMAQSRLANELRMLYHNLIGGHSMNVAFNGVKSVNMLLFCKDHGFTLSGSEGSVGGSGGGGGLGGARPERGKRSLSGEGPASIRVKGINLNTHTMLTIADSECIMNVLHSLDRSSISEAAVGGIGAWAGLGTGSATGASAGAGAGASHGLFNFSSSSGAGGVGVTIRAQNTNRSAASLAGLVSSSSGASLTSLGEGTSNAPKQPSPQQAQAQARAQAQAHAQAQAQAQAQRQKQLSNSRLYSFLAAADPTQSFLDLALMLDEPVEELISMANYLQSWGLAEIIPVIYRRSCLKVHHAATITRGSRVGRAYEALLRSLDVPFQYDGYTTPEAPSPKGQWGNQGGQGGGGQDQGPGNQGQVQGQAGHGTQGAQDKVRMRVRRAQWWARVLLWVQVWVQLRVQVRV